MSKEYWKPGNMLYPVPAVMVSCGREGEKPNIITVAWAGTICSDPAMVSISVRKENFKDFRNENIVLSFVRYKKNNPVSISDILLKYNCHE